MKQHHSFAADCFGQGIDSVDMEKERQVRVLDEGLKLHSAEALPHFLPRDLPNS